MGRRYARRNNNEPVVRMRSLDELAIVCEDYFASLECTVRRDDAAKTIWVSADGGKLEVAVQAAAVERQGLERTLERVEERLGLVAMR